MRTILLLIAVMAMVMTDVRCQVDEKCVFPSTAYVTIGRKNYLCAKIVSGNYTFVYSYAITADKFTVLSLSNLTAIYQSIALNDPIYLHLQFQNSDKTTEILISDGMAQVHRNLISAVIQTRNGVFQSIVNDSQDCSMCNFGTDTCYQDQCFKTGTLTEQSTFLIYISWIGTDSNRQNSISYTHRLNKLSRFSLTNIFLQAFNIY